jgi:hypothetical protein
MSDELTAGGALATGFALIFLFVIVGGLFWGTFALYKEYNVWASAMDGKAQLAQADWNRQIAVREAMAKEQSASQLAQAEIIRAQGVAKANQIIGQSLNNNEAYLRYLWIENLQNEQNQVIYVPTEANLPILEANRLKPVVAAASGN